MVLMTDHVGKHHIQCSGGAEYFQMTDDKNEGIQNVDEEDTEVMVDKNTSEVCNEERKLVR